MEYKDLGRGHEHELRDLPRDAQAGAGAPLARDDAALEHRGGDERDSAPRAMPADMRATTPPARASAAAGGAGARSARSARERAAAAGVDRALEERDEQQDERRVERLHLIGLYDDDAPRNPHAAVEPLA